MGTITGQVNSINSVSGKNYTTDQLVLYADVSPCPTATSKSVTITITCKYTTATLNESTVWKFASAPTVTLSTKLPFNVYVCVKGVVPTSSSASQGSNSFVSFTKTLTKNTTYSNSAMSVGPYYNVATAVPAVNGVEIQSNGISSGLSSSTISTYTQVNAAVGTTSLTNSQKFVITASTPTVV